MPIDQWKDLIRLSELNQIGRAGESIESLDVRSGKVLAKWNSSLTAITDEEVKNHIIVVGALGKNSFGKYQKASFSNHGERIDVMAPGIDILSTVPVSSHNPDGYQLMSGTSMACPHVTGIVAMMYQVNPELNGANVKQILVDIVKETRPCFKNKGCITQ